VPPQAISKVDRSRGLLLRTEARDLGEAHWAAAFGLEPLLEARGVLSVLAREDDNLVVIFVLHPGKWEGNGRARRERGYREEFSKGFQFKALVFVVF
jgi:hypothetical protein|tara:strand:+ start:459 stop:749 length:291 start_codon:yes stop_codon:yes gene_type:complete